MHVELRDVVLIAVLAYASAPVIGSHQIRSHLSASRRAAEPHRCKIYLSYCGYNPAFRNISVSKHTRANLRSTCTRRWSVVGSSSARDRMHDYSHPLIHGMCAQDVRCLPAPKQLRVRTDNATFGCVKDHFCTNDTHVTPEPHAIYLRLDRVPYQNCRDSKLQPRQQHRDRLI